MRHSTAELWLMAWGEIKRDRSGGGIGKGVGEGGRYRPEDDPHPSSWVVAQVERVLARLDPIERRVAIAVYVGGRGLCTLYGELGHRNARNARQRLLQAVNEAVVLMRERTIAEAQAKQLLESGTFDSEAWDQIVAFLLDREGMRFRCG